MLQTRRKSKIDYNRLCEAIVGARKETQFSREERRERVKQYAGTHWSENGPSEKVPVNLLAKYIRIVSRSLIAKNPRILLTAGDRSIKASVATMEKWGNLEIEKMHLASSLRRIAIDALFGPCGIAKICLATPEDASLGAWARSAGTAFLQRVDWDDFVWDMHAKTFQEAGYLGHRLRMPLDVVREDRRFHKSRKDLQPTEQNEYNSEGDERIGNLGKSGESNRMEFEDFVDLWEIYLPRRGEVVTIATDEGGQPMLYDDQPLLTQEWIGPYCGPYQFLAFMEVPGNAMPLGPVQHLIDMHKVVNGLYRKLIDQAERQKDIFATRGAQDADGNRIVAASDGQMIRLDDPQGTIPISMGGPNNLNFQFSMEMRKLFDDFGGNLSLLGGEAAQSATATQDKMLNENSSAGIADMQETTTIFVAECMKSLCWYWWYDPQKIMKADYDVPGLPQYGKTLEVHPYNPDNQNFEELFRRGAMIRNAPFEAMNVRVDPYSLRHQAPQQRLQAINAVIQQLMPMMPMLQQQGVVFDVNAYLKLIQRYLDQPDLSDVFTVSEPIMPQGEPSGPETLSPASTSREYVRRSVSEKTPDGDRKMDQMELIAGGKPQSAANVLSNGRP